MVRYYIGKVKTMLPFFGLDDGSPLIDEKWRVKRESLVCEFEFVENQVQIRLNFKKVAKTDIKISVSIYDFISGKSENVGNFVLCTDKVKSDYSYFPQLLTVINWCLDSCIHNVKPCEF